MNAALGTIAFRRQRRVDRRTGAALGLASLPFALVAAMLCAHLPDRPFKLIFGLLLAAASVTLLLRGRPDHDPPPQGDGAGDVERRFTDRDGHLHHYRYRRRVRLVIGAVTGFVSSLTGVGGGVLLVPLLHLRLAMPAHIASGTSHFAVLFSALFGSVAHHLLGHISWPHAGWIVAGVVAGSPLGAHASRRITGRTLLAIVAAVMLAIAARLIARGLGILPPA